jgi:hypothetical protein
MNVPRPLPALATVNRTSVVVPGAIGVANGGSTVPKVRSGRSIELIVAEYRWISTSGSGAQMRTGRA